MYSDARIPVLQIETFQPKSYGDIYVNDFKSHLTQFSNHIQRPHNHNFFLVVLFTRGTGKHFIDFKKYDIRPGSMFFLKPGQTHNWHFTKDINGYIFFHTTAFYNWSFPHKDITTYPFYSNLFNQPEIRLNQSETKTMVTCYKELLDEFKNNAQYKFEKMALIIETIYINISRISKLNTAPMDIISIDFQRTQEFEKLTAKYFRDQRNLAFYEEKLSISVRQLNRSLVKTLGKSATQIIHEKIIHEANILLHYTEKNIKEIAFNLSFHDTSHFVKFYKNKTGLSPNEFRNKRKY